MNARPALAVLHGQSQIYFQASWVTGLLFIAAFAVVDVWMALFAVLGAAVQSGVSWLVPTVDRQEVVDGKHGFCGSLTAAAAYSALGFTFASLMWAVVGSAACVGVVPRGRRAGLRGGLGSGW